MKRLFALLLVLSMVFCGCATEPEPPQQLDTPTESQTLPTEPSTQPPAPSTQESSSEDPTQPVEPPVPEVLRNPLNGSVIKEVNENRPFAVVINNISVSMPQCGVSQADIIYEILAEGGITRCLALYTDIRDIEKLGSVRSARPYFVELAMAHDAIFVHAGGSLKAYDAIAQTGIDHIDGVKGQNSTLYFYRDQKRLDAGVPLEHTMFISGQKAVAYCQDLDCTMTREDPWDHGLLFSEEVPLDGTDANKVTVTFRGGKTTTMTYEEASGLYKARQYGRDYIDGNDNSVMKFRNVLVLTAEADYDVSGYRIFFDLVGDGTGWYACGGQMVPIRWSRANESAPFRYTLEDGTPLVLGTGKTYIGIVTADTPVKAE